MTIVLHLGVNDIPYSAPLAPPPKKPRAQAKTGKANKPRRPPGASQPGMTTFGVAQILEDKYGVMQAFADLHMPEIVGALEDAISGSIQSLFQGGSGAISSNALAAGESLIQNTFMKFLDERGFDGLLPGVPTQAAQRGVNHRLMRPYAKSNPARPSFIDTGLYQANFRAWVDHSS